MPELEARELGVTLAYIDDRVPPSLRVRFVVAGPSLYDWLVCWLEQGQLRATDRRWTQR